MPGLKPFGEFQGDTRVHDLRLDRNGYCAQFQRRLCQGRHDVRILAAADRRSLDRLCGARPIRSASQRSAGPVDHSLADLDRDAADHGEFGSNTSIDETTLPGVSGVLTRTYTVEVDHDFRRWLTGIGKFTYGTLDYQGDGRSDKIYSISGDLVYKLNRNIWIKGTLRRDWLDSNLPGNSTASTVVMLGVRLQH